MKTFFSALLFATAFALFVSCQSADRAPASVWNLNDALEKAYNADLNLSLALEDKKNSEKLAEVRGRPLNGEQQLVVLPKDPSVEKIENLEKDRRYRLDFLQSGLNSTLGSEIEPFSILANIQIPWRKQKERLLLNTLEPYLSTAAPTIPKYFAMNLNGAKDYELWIDNRFFSQNGKIESYQQHSPANNQPYLEAQITCDGPFKISRTFFTDYSKTGETVKFRIYDSEINAEKIKFIPSLQITDCKLQFVNPDDRSKVYKMSLMPESVVFKNKSQYRSIAEGCVLPFFENLGPTETFFLTSDFNSMTCPLKVQNLKTLENSEEGFQEKVKALLGQPLPQNFFKTQNPFLPLDFSKAPVLDEILISYLVYRSDFYGNVMTRLLDFHASRGAIIRILVSDPIQLKKDRQMLYALTHKYNNVKLQEYHWLAPDWAGLTDRLSQLHKSMHVKMFITMSAKYPQYNMSIIGGRNIHDGFLFKLPPNYKSFPNLIQYPTEESFIHWRDFEVKVQDQKFVWQSAAHFMTLWELDSETFFQRSINLNLSQPQKLSTDYFNKAAQGKSSSSEDVVRHLMSIPFKDEMALEKFYIQMFDSAQKNIFISTPYLNLSHGLSEALARANNRGVKVTIITRLDLKGDTVDFILSDVNKKAVNQFVDKLEIFEYTEPQVILHSKVTLIDDTLSFVGSVNLNRRSFIHDLENGLLVYGKGYNSKMSDILKNYQKSAKKITENQKIRFINKVILSVPAIREAL